ncbi:MAG: TrpB-like pyridoxal phosphate-dependent enzyme [Anaerolineales bacterium]|nr:TrpB-like pyridoxal phosphate-dependent enzyme [Anaerolineales bacterium]
MVQKKYLLNESDLPQAWYNINADIPVKPEPVLHPQTLEPVTPDFLSQIFPMSLIEQEVSADRYIPIPDEVQEIYKLWRPTPLVRARQLELALDTPAHIYFKNESVSPTGSHKPNTAVPQAFYNKQEGVESLTTETGAGQWGSALSMAGSFFDLNIEVYMVKVSYDQKPYRRLLMESFGGEVYPSPSDRTAYGRAVLAENPDSPGSLGMAISEAVEAAVTSEGKKKYSLGSVLNHVLTHQSIIGEETLKQMDLAGEYPDVVIGCVGGGSNFGGIAYPFLRENLLNGQKTRLLAVEPAATPSLTKGVYAFDYGDTARIAPVLKMHTLGHEFIPAPLHAGGLRYHGMSASISALYNGGYIEAVAVPQLGTFEAGLLFSRTEGIIPAPESAHAIRIAIDEALEAKELGEKRVIVFNLSGHGYFDLVAYQEYLQGDLQNYQHPQQAIDEALKKLPEVTL